MKKKSDQTKILIIDDDKGIIEATKFLLEYEGYQVESDSKAHSVEFVIKCQPELILLDLWLTKVDGRMLCQALKKNPETKDIPVILFSASQSIELNAQQAGADDYISKPFEIDALLEKIKKLLV